MQTFLMAFVIALVVSFCLTPLVKKLAFLVNAIDEPDYRKVHKKIMPRMGGLAIYLGFVVAVIYLFPMSREIQGLLLGSTCVLALGLADDILHISAKQKLSGQIIAATVLIYFGISIDWLNDPFGSGYIYLEWMAIPLTIVWVVSLTNVVNLMDGLDGLAAGVSCIATSTLAYVACTQGLFQSSLLAVCLVGSILGFLPYNFNPAKIFMGDTGSMFLGYTFAAISIIGAMKSTAIIALALPAIMLGLPILDTACAIIRRYKTKQPIFAPDKGHFHHRLLAFGLSQKQAVLSMYAISIGFCIGAALLTESESSLAVGVIGTTLVVICVLAKKIGFMGREK